jgi:hypothetical protein
MAREEALHKVAEACVKLPALKEHVNAALQLIKAELKGEPSGKPRKLLDQLRAQVEVDRLECVSTGVILDNHDCLWYWVTICGASPEVSWMLEDYVQEKLDRDYLYELAWPIIVDTDW